MADKVKSREFPIGKGFQEIGGQAVFVTGRIILDADSHDKARVMRHYLEELNAICDVYGAWIDMSVRNKVFVKGTTKSCRKAIRKLYGKGAQHFRMGHTVELAGFTKES